MNILQETIQQAYKTWSFQKELEVIQIAKRIQAYREEEKRKHNLELIKRSTERHKIKAIQYKRIKK